jgi:hypothetical protein
MLHNGPVDGFNATVPHTKKKLSPYLNPHQHNFHKDLSNFIVSFKSPDISFNEAPSFVDASDLVRLEEVEADKSFPCF